MTEMPDAASEGSGPASRRSARSIVLAIIGVLGLCVLAGAGVVTLLWALGASAGVLVDRETHPATYELPEFVAFAAAVPGVAEVTDAWSEEPGWLEGGGSISSATLILAPDADRRAVAETVREWISDPARASFIAPQLRFGSAAVSLTHDAEPNDARFALLDALADLDGVTRVSILDNAIVLEAPAGPFVALTALTATPLGTLVDEAYQSRPTLVLTGPRDASRPAPAGPDHYSGGCEDGASCARIPLFDAGTGFSLTFLDILDTAPELRSYRYSCSADCELTLTLQPGATLSAVTSRLAGLPEFETLARISARSPD